MYKIIHSLVSIPSHHLIPSTSHTCHHNFTYQLPQSRINSHLYSLFPSAIRLWNSLDQVTVNKSSLSQFKTALHNLANHCNCVTIAPHTCKLHAPYTFVSVFCTTSQWVLHTNSNANTVLFSFKWQIHWHKLCDRGLSCLRVIALCLRHWKKANLSAYVFSVLNCLYLCAGLRVKPKF